MDPRPQPAFTVDDRGDCTGRHATTATQPLETSSAGDRLLTAIGALARRATAVRLESGDGGHFRSQNDVSPQPRRFAAP
jgi:hypothetical protein